MTLVCFHELPDTLSPRAAYRLLTGTNKAMNYHKVVSSPSTDTELYKVSFQPQIQKMAVLACSKVQLREALLLVANHPY